MDSMKIFVIQTVKEAFSDALDTTDGNAELKGFVRDAVKQAMEDDSLSAALPRNEPIPPLDKMKLVQDAMSQHQTFSRVLYVLALGTPITLLIARTVRDKDTDKLPDKKMIRNTALEMGFSFLAVSVCHLYVIIFHFVRTEAPRLSMRATRVIIIFLCTIVSAWIVVYAFHMPERLFQTFFWWIIGPFLGANWILSAVVGCTGLLKQKHVIKV